jgi:ABC-type transport system substrate-binding protein
MVEYEAVDNHWRQTPDFKKLTLVLMPEETTRIASLKTGAVDIIDVGIEGAADAKAAGLKVASLSTNVDTVRLFGTYEPESASLPTADVRVRQALSLAINREEMRNTIMYGLSGPPAAGGVLFNSIDIDAAYWESYCAKIYRYDPEEAKSLLKEAGYPNGFTIKIYSFAQGGAPYLPKFCEVIQGYWQKIGVNAQLVPIDYGVFQTLRKSGKGGAPAPEVLGQAALNGSSEDRLAINKILSVYTSTNRRELVGKTFPDLDKLIASAMSEMDNTKRKQYIAQALQQGLDMYVDIGVSISPQLAAIGPKVSIDFPEATKTIMTRVDIAKHTGQ